ncbi:VanZ family protein [Ideonella sp. BN130291]|uniref:VanZ family protein n=1 Tax=Ideonella sp. BN130291 TaxID=3112940 RepID=UPI002E274F12|nr:VanZ family protein [Ideonella sp. BN130291]
MPSPSNPRPLAALQLLRSVWFWRVLLALLVCVVAYLALTPEPPSDMATGWDKVKHMMAFSTLAVCAQFSGLRTRWPLMLAMAGLLAFGGAIEVIQPEVGRNAEWADLLADAVGILAGTSAALWLSRSRLMRKA